MLWLVDMISFRWFVIDAVRVRGHNRKKLQNTWWKHTSKMSADVAETHRGTNMPVEGKHVR